MDTIILPDDKTVDEDFWKSKSDVALMVNGAYAAMNTEDVISRLMVWGDFRSDEFIMESTLDNNSTANALLEIAAANTQIDNMYCNWSGFYSIINKCNIVLEKAAEMYNAGVDPNYTEGDYLSDRSQMLALRSLCYFYLVRAFRDVPYVSEAYMNSSKDRTFVQMPPSEVLQHCIEDLEEAAKSALSARGYTVSQWRRVGWFTQDAIYSLLADIYLWRASVMHSDADYQKCVEYCDLVIESKKAQHVPGRNETVVSEYPLATTANMYSDLFVNQNAEESIFEIQSEANSAVCKMLFKWKDNSSMYGFWKATSIFKAVAANPNTNGMLVFPTNDIRFYASLFSNSGVETFDVRKMISETSYVTTSSQARTTSASRGFSGFNQNWIVYRLTDVMLMKAEALVQRVDTSMAGLTDTEKKSKDSINTLKLQNAYYLVAAVNKRSCTNTDTLAWSKLSATNHNGKSGMEKLVMEERQRELCFEGKRWFDLLRYNYRHVEGVNYNAILADQQGSLVANYDDMLSLMVRGRGTDGAGVKAKMQNEAYLYMPLPYNDIILSPEMKQNPAYGSSNEYQRN
jgi:hypothetical protein